MGTTNKGIVFALDLAVSFLLMSATLLLLVSALDARMQKTSGQSRQLYLEQKAISIADSLVKNSDSSNPVFGAAYYNAEKKRVEENVLDLELLKKADAGSLQEIRRIYLKYDGMEEVFAEKELGKNCAAVERFVLLKQQNKKALAGIVVCSE